MQRLFLIFCLIFVASAGAQERPLDGYCGPNSISEKIKHAYDTKSFYRAKRHEVLEFRDKSIKNVRLVPLNHKQDVDNARAEMRREAVMFPEMYQGEMRALNIELNRELLSSINGFWSASRLQFKEDIEWTDKCLEFINEKLH
tara:strand:+ start:314 stop:742 length:429 start_codon:yes stop_codon:yes gene_type:complete